MISTSTVVNSVVEKLRAALKRGQWRRGEMLPGQRELAEQMGISRPSLREAVIVLETLGLVRSMPGKGVVVLETSVSEPQSSDAVAHASLEDILQLRYTLEPFIVGSGGPDHQQQGCRPTAPDPDGHARGPGGR